MSPIQALGNSAHLVRSGGDAVALGAGLRFAFLSSKSANASV
jgi:hypothetical protein